MTFSRGKFSFLLEGIFVINRGNVSHLMEAISAN